MPIQATCSVDTSGLQAAIQERLKFPGRTEAQAVNTAAFYIAKRVKENVPFVEQQTIDSELGVTKEVIFRDIKFRHLGIVMSVPTKRKKTVIGKGDSEQEVPLAALIVIARAGGGSASPGYNASTNWRYAITKNPFKGVTRAQGRAAMKAAVSRMIKARHSSTHFLQAAWVGILSVMKRYAKSRTGGIASAGWSENKLGYAIPALEGSSKVTCVLVDNTGMEGVNSVSINKAVWVNTAPILQRAVDEEAANLLKTIEELNRARNEKFNRMAK